MAIENGMVASTESQINTPFTNDDIEWHKWDFLGTDISERDPEDINYQIDMAITLADKDDLRELIYNIFDSNDNYAKSFEQLHIKKERA